MADPEDRELTIACGAALFHLLTALRHLGTAPRAALLPDRADPDLLARVEPRGGRPAEDEDHAVLRAVPE